METLIFHHNWNNKLHCYVMTTIRLRNDAKYKKSARFKVILKVGEKQNIFGVFEVVDIRHVKLHEIPSYIAYLDTGYDVHKTRDIIKTMYKHKSPSIDWNTQDISIILLKKDLTLPTIFDTPNPKQQANYDRQSV
jgi:hypothetical protein